MPAVPFARGEPRERAECGGDDGAHDRRVKADRERVRPDGGEAGQLGGDAANPEKACEPDRTRGHGCDLEAVDGQALVEARGSEPREERVVEALGTPEDDR